MDSRFVTTPDGVRLHVASCGEGTDVLVLSGGPGCVHYLAQEALAPEGFRGWFPDPRGVGSSTGGPHTMPQAIADLETLRTALGVDRWLVVGHSWGSDLAVRYALDHPHAVRGLVGLCGHGLHRDREWSEAYQRGLGTETPVPVDHEPEVHAALWGSFPEWIHTPRLWRSIADSPVPMTFIAAAQDIRPSWPLQQLAELAPRGRYGTVSDVEHDFWHTHPETWRATVTDACRRLDAAE